VQGFEALHLAGEPRACVGRYDEGEQRWSLTTSTANPHRIRLLLSQRWR